jgi:triacylglycerol esterase/lipase EstA (alpha/beta hydrolase family)
LLCEHAVVVFMREKKTDTLWWRMQRGVTSARQMFSANLPGHLAQLPLVGLTLLAPVREVTALPDDGHAPIIFVHGHGGGPGNFLPMRTYFGRSGRTRTYAFSLLPGEPLEGMALRLARMIEDVVVVNGLPADTAQVDVVGHSLGGIVSRLALTSKATARRVRTLVTLGSPHHGTDIAYLTREPAVRRLLPDSEIMTRLRTQLPWSSDLPRLVSLWSRRDMLVLPQSSACVPGAENVEMRGFTHYSFLLSPRSWSKVFQLLAPSPAA